MCIIFNHSNEGFYLSQQKPRRNFLSGAECGNMAGVSVIVVHIGTWQSSASRDLPNLPQCSWTCSLMTQKFVTYSYLLNAQDNQHGWLGSQSFTIMPS